MPREEVSLFVARLSRVFSPTGAAVVPDCAARFVGELPRCVVFEAYIAWLLALAGSVGAPTGRFSALISPLELYSVVCCAMRCAITSSTCCCHLGSPSKKPCVEVDVYVRPLPVPRRCSIYPVVGIIRPPVQAIVLLTGVHNVQQVSNHLEDWFRVPIPHGCCVDAKSLNPFRNGVCSTFWF